MRRRFVSHRSVMPRKAAVCFAFSQSCMVIYGYRWWRTGLYVKHCVLRQAPLRGEAGRARQQARGTSPPAARSGGGKRGTLGTCGRVCVTLQEILSWIPYQLVRASVVGIVGVGASRQPRMT